VLTALSSARVLQPDADQAARVVFEYRAETEQDRTDFEIGAIL
jgi:hypothetical protein